MSVLVDSSVWIDYFRGSLRDEGKLEYLIDEGWISTNDLILAELLPSLMIQKESRLVALLQEIHHLPLTTNWKELVEDQVTCLRKGINGVGIPDLMIAQNARHHEALIYTHDKHFLRMAAPLKIKLL
jgi:predicted nucleic acid-binding protein